MKLKKQKTKKASKFKDKIKNFFKIPEEVFQEEESPNFERQKLFTLTRINICIGLFLFLLITNLLVIFNVDFIYLRQILGFLFLISVPGLILMLCFKIRKVGFWEYLVYTVGLSIAFIMFAGLIVNWTLPWLGITNQPLSLYPILICFDIFLIILGIVAFKRNKDFKPKDFTIPKLNALNIIFFTIPMIFPVLAILGAFLLNNHGTNILTMIMFGGISVYVLLLVIFKKKLSKNIYPWAVLMIGLGILLSWWLRSWYVSGVDSTLEFLVFQLTKENSFWAIGNYRNAYNAMLSLTILPTVISVLTDINDHFIFKLLFQSLFSFVPLITFLIFKKISKKNLIIFFGSLFFVIQTYFIAIQMRQAIAFIFFSLLVLIIIEDRSQAIKSKLFFIIFGFSMVVSHYSTSYIALAVLFLIKIVYWIYKKWKRK